MGRELEVISGGLAQLIGDGILRDEEDGEDREA
jgi:hypothetical protein